MQQYADIYLLLNYSTCFGRPSRSSSGVHKTAVAASSTDHTIWGAIFLKRVALHILYKHTSDCVETVFELPLLTNNNELNKP